MSSIYDKASLVLIPSGTKTSKVYSQKPTNGDGDFTFSRSTAATRVNASGNIEKETQNLLLQSNTFDTTWTQSDIATLTSGQSGYDGNSDAWLVEKSASSNGYLRQNISSSGVHTFSLYAKSDTLNGVLIQTRGASTKSAQFDLSTGTLGTASNNIDAKIEDVGSGWYRCSVSVNDSAITQVRVFICDDGTTIGTTAGSIYIQDTQLEQGLVARSYNETTTSAFEGGITDNVPRLDYTDSSCPALLLEPQRTNLIPYSEYFGTSDWIKLGIGTGSTPIITHNYTISPDGSQNATRIQLDLNGGTTSGDQSLIYDDLGVKSGDHTRSIYIKSNTSDVDLYFGGTLTDKKIITATTEWQRFYFKSTLSSATLYATIGLRGTTGSSDVADISIWGFQAEAGSYPTSYIPTYGSAVTRNAEACNSAGTSATFNDSEGVLFVELEALAEDSTYRFISVSDGTSTNRINILLNNNNTLRAFVAGVGSLISSVDITQNNKAAIKYKSGDYAFWVNGTEVATNTSTSGTHTGLNELAFDMGDGSNDFYGKTKQVLYIPTALTDAELEDLTTL